MSIADNAPDLATALTAVRLSLHVGAACVFVGGQLVVAGLLPTVRALGTEAPRRVARAFARLSWPAFIVLVATGIWNVGAVHAFSASPPYKIVLWTKIGVVAMAGIAAAAHSVARSRPLIAATGTLSGIASLAALVLGVVLAG